MAAELQMLWVDRENWKKQGTGFFKFDDEAITTVQEDLIGILYELAANHKEEVVCLMEEYDAHEIDAVPSQSQLPGSESDRYERKLEGVEQVWKCQSWIQGSD